MKKITTMVLILCLMLLGCALAGCGGSSSDQEQNQQTKVNENAGAENTESEDTVTLEDIFAKSGEIESLTFEWEMTGTDGFSSSGTQYIQGANLRMDTSAQGVGQTTMIYKGDSNEAWMINMAENTAMKLGLDDAEIESVNPLEPMSDYEQDMYNVVGQEAVDGKMCTVIEVTEGAAYTKMWVWEEYGFPLKMEIKAEGNQINYQYKNVSFDKIPDSIFEVPAGVQVIDMQDLQGLQNMGQSMGQQ